MKTNSIIQGTLGVAVIALFILHFQQPKNETAPKTAIQKEETTEIVTVTPEVSLDSTSTIEASEIPASNKIAYVNIDSLNIQYDYVDQLEAKFKRKSVAKQKELEAEAKSLQEEYMMFVKQAQAGMLKQEQAMQMEQDFKDRQMKLMQKEQETGMKLEMQHMESNKEIMERVSKYLDTYAQQNDFDVILAYGTGAGVLYAKQGLDITKEVVNGLNSELKKK